MPPFPLDTPPGFLKVDSSVSAGGRIIGGDHVRFVRRRAQKWLGWNKLIATAVVGIARGAVAWATQYFTTDAAFGTHLKLYALTGNDTLTDITPIRSTGTLGNNPFTTTLGSAVVTVAHTAHGANDQDFVTFAGALGIPGNDGFTKALLHMDGTDAATTFIDDNAGGSAHTWTARGNAQIDTADKEFGTASGLFDGTGDYIDTPDHADFALGSGDFTIDCWFKCTAPTGSARRIAGQCDATAVGTGNSFNLRRLGGGSDILFARVSVGTTNYDVQTTAQYTDVTNPGWHHVAVVRSGGTLTLYVDGVAAQSTAITGTVNDVSNNLSVGRMGETVGGEWQGWIDEFRLSVGIARWTANFTPPTVAYGSAGDGGEVISGEYQLTRIDNDSYSITTSAPFTGSGSGGGAAVTYSYQINTGLADSAVGLGFGAGPFGASTYGTARSTGIALEIRTWSLSEYGNNLLASPSGGGLYQWRDGTDTNAVVISNAPTAMRAMFVTPEGFIFALGTTTPMTVQWPDQIDNTLWTPASNNTANNRKLAGGSRLMGGMGVVDGVSLVWSDTSTFLFQYTGANAVYDSRIVGDSTGLAGPLARAKHMGIAYWMSPQCRFQMYTGFAQDIPNAEDVRAFILADIDTGRITKTWARYDANHNQVRWHYCSLASTTGEPDKYVDVGLNGDFEWTTGTLDRTTGCQFRPSDGSNLLVSSVGYIYSHDEGLDADGAALESYITYGPRQAAQGQTNLDIMGVIPDVERQVGTLTYELAALDRPDSAAAEDTVTVSLSPGDIIGDARLEGRLIEMTIRSNAVGGDYRLGTPALEIQDAGERR